jgi:hypothetical protein
LQPQSADRGIFFYICDEHSDNQTQIKAWVFKLQIRLLLADLFWLAIEPHRKNIKEYKPIFARTANTLYQYSSSNWCIGQ